MAFRFEETKSSAELTATSNHLIPTRRALIQTDSADSPPLAEALAVPMNGSPVPAACRPHHADSAEPVPAHGMVYLLRLSTGCRPWCAKRHGPA